MAAIVRIRAAESSTETAEEKERQLLTKLGEIPSLIIALSGGADSAYLAWAAQRALGHRALSVTALSPSYSTHDRNIVEEFVRIAKHSPRIRRNSRNGKSCLPRQCRGPLLLLQG